MTFQKKLSGLVLAGLAALFMAGCQTTNYQRAENTSKSMLVFRENMVAVRNQTGATLKDLNAISQQATGDSTKDFERYQSALAKLETLAQNAKSQAKDMDTKGKEYFAAWDQELANVQSPDIRARATAKRAEIVASYDKLAGEMHQAAALFDPFLKRLQDVRTMFASDLSVRTISDARDLIKQSNIAGAEVLNQLDDVIADLNAVNAALAPGK